MDEPKNEGALDRIFNSIDAKFGIERPPEVNVIYQYPQFGDPVLWIDRWTKVKDFKPWYYREGSFTSSSDIRTIPASNIANVIHFLPPEAKEASSRTKTEEVSWLDDEKFRFQGLLMIRKYIPALVDLLNNIRSGKLSDIDYIIGETNYRMANMALAFGFKRCWEEGYKPPDLSRPMIDESMNYRIGVSVVDLVEHYDLKNQAPTEKLVSQKMKEYIIGRRAGKT